MRDWAAHTHGSPLYASLALVIAADSELLRVINRITHQPPPNMLLAAVQFLLSRGLGPELARHYPSLHDEPLPPDQAGPAFRRFVLENEEALVDIGNTRYTQTNECRRCVALMPMASMAGYETFHLVDVGTSAGLNLALDLYRYRIGDRLWGPASRVLLEAESRGETPTLGEFEVLGRVGLDLHPIDPANGEERQWLEALIWPEHSDRRRRLRAALDIVGGLGVELVAGDALETLGDVLAGLPPGDPVVVMNSFSLMQLTSESRESLEEVVRIARGNRAIHRVSMEVLDMSDKWAELVIDDGEGPEVVGRAHPHGEWVEFYARP